MNVTELFEGKVSPAWRKKFEARIVLGYADNVKVVGGDKDLSKDAWLDAKAKAKVTFDKLVEEHPDGLCFKTYKEAVDHMMSMPYPNWPLKIEKRLGTDGRSRVEPITIDYKDATLDDVQIEKLENGRNLVSIKAKSGPSMKAFMDIFHRLYKKKRWSKDGKKEIEYPWRGNAFQTDATEAQIRAEIGETKNVSDETAKRKAHEATPEFKKEKNKSDYAWRKEKKRLDERDKKNRRHFADVARTVIDEVWPKDGPRVSGFQLPSFQASNTKINVLLRLPETEKSPLSSMSDDPAVQKRLKVVHDKKYNSLNDLIKKLMEKFKGLDNFVSVKHSNTAYANEVIVTFKMIE